MKIKKIFFALAFTIIMTLCFIKSPNAAVFADVYVDYLGSNRKPTFDYTKTNLMKTSFNVNGFDTTTANNVENQLKRGVMLIIHNHGAPGIQYVGAENSNNAIVGKSAGSNQKAVNSMTGNATKKMGMAIYFGCSTGVTTSSHGDLAQETVNKFSKSAIAWNVTTYVPEVNDWTNYLTLSFAPYGLNTKTAAQSLKDADYQLRLKSGSVAGDRMQLNRVERGNFSWKWGDLLK